MCNCRERGGEGGGVLEVWDDSESMELRDSCDWCGESSDVRLRGGVGPNDSIERTLRGERGGLGWVRGGVQERLSCSSGD